VWVTVRSGVMLARMESVADSNGGGGGSGRKEEEGMDNEATRNLRQPYGDNDYIKNLDEMKEKENDKTLLV
jgi:hypothetical protein